MLEEQGKEERGERRPEGGGEGREGGAGPGLPSANWSCIKPVNESSAFLRLNSPRSIVTWMIKTVTSKVNYLLQSFLWKDCSS